MAPTGRAAQNSPAGDLHHINEVSQIKAGRPRTLLLYCTCYVPSNFVIPSRR